MTKLRFASWNVNSLKVRLPQVLEWLESARVDALALEETKLTDEAFPLETFREAGFEAVFCGQKTYNGTALCLKRSAFEVCGVQLGLPGYADPQKRFVSALLTPKGAVQFKPIRFCAAYVPNGMAVGASKYLYKLEWLSVLGRAVKGYLKETPQLILGGDFNIAPTDADVWSPELWRDKILCSAPERNALERLLDLGLADAFRLFDQPAESFSWWDYRQNGFEKNHGLRIDLLLASEALVPFIAASGIDTAPRENPQPSDHAPVTLDLELQS